MLRVGFVLRSTEIHPALHRFVPSVHAAYCGGPVGCHSERGRRSWWVQDLFWWHYFPFRRGGSLGPSTLRVAENFLHKSNFSTSSAPLSCHIYMRRKLGSPIKHLNRIRKIGRCSYVIRVIFATLCAIKTTAVRRYVIRPSETSGLCEYTPMCGFDELIVKICTLNMRYSIAWHRVNGDMRSDYLPDAVKVAERRFPWMESSE